jgi:cell division protein FtsB
MNEQSQLIDSFVSDVTVKQKRTAVFFITVSLIAVVAGLALLGYFGKQVKLKLDQVSALEEQSTKLSDENADLELKNRDAKAQLKTTTDEMNEALAKLETIYKSNLPASAKSVLAEAIAKIRGAETTVSRIETELRTTRKSDSSQPTITRSEAISDLFSDKAGKRYNAYDVLMDQYSNDPELVPELLSYARRNPDNLNGIYNTLVVLSHLNKTQLKPHVADIRAFAKEVEPAGPRIKQRVDKLLSRLPS